MSDGWKIPYEELPRGDALVLFVMGRHERVVLYGRTTRRADVIKVNPKCHVDLEEVVYWQYVPKTPAEIEEAA